jgi:hypothetical protein
MISSPLLLDVAEFLGKIEGSWQGKTDGRYAEA